MSVLIADLEVEQGEHAERCSTCRADSADGCNIYEAYSTVIEDLFNDLPPPRCEWCGKFPCREGCTRGPGPNDARQACVSCGQPVIAAPGVEPKCGPCRWG